MTPTKNSQQVLVAVAQPMVVPGDVQGNLQRMEPLIRQAGGAGARLVLFSENALNGYDHYGVGARSAVTLEDAAFAQLRALARENDITIVSGFFERDPQQRIFNSAAIVQPSGDVLVQRKHQVTALEVRTGGVQAGQRERVMFEVDGVRMAVLICADAGIVDIHRELRAAGCDAIVAPTAGLGSDEQAFFQAELSDPARLAAYVKASEGVCFISPEQCVRHDMALICANQMGYSKSHKYFHCGHAAVIDRTGEITALIPGRYVVEHLRPVVAVGFISKRRA